MRPPLHAASIRFRRTRAEAKGTPPINMASCVASIVTCDVGLPQTEAFRTFLAPAACTTESIRLAPTTAP